MHQCTISELTALCTQACIPNSSLRNNHINSTSRLALPTDSNGTLLHQKFCIPCLYRETHQLTYFVPSKIRSCHHHHHVVPLAWISLTLSRNFSQSFISSGRSSGLHPVSSHSCCMYVQAGCPAFARPYVGVHRSTSLMNSSLLLQKCPACLVRLIWIVFVMGGRWLYSWCLVG